MREIPRRKEYVEVTVRIDENGIKHPLSIKFQGLKTYEVERLRHIIDRRASKVGGTGSSFLSKKPPSMKKMRESGSSKPRRM